MTATELNTLARWSHQLTADEIRQLDALVDGRLHETEPRGLRRLLAWFQDLGKRSGNDTELLVTVGSCSNLANAWLSRYVNA